MLRSNCKFGETLETRAEAREYIPNGDDRVRTDGLRSASAALSQLSYIPLPQTLISIDQCGPG
jgi:hypothetical protein